MEALIIGAAESPYTRHPPPNLTTPVALADAARRALADAGLRPDEIDGLGVSSFSLVPDHAIDLAVRLGLRLRWLMDGATGGASAVDMLQHARRAVEAGDARCILLVAGDRLDAGDFVGLVDEYNVATRDHLAPLPTGGPNALFALLTQRHMSRHGLGRDVYGKIVVSQRCWAESNPKAVYRTPLTLPEYIAAPPVADPLTIYDCVPVVAGADAVVVSESADGPSVRIRALTASHNTDLHEGDGLATGLLGVAAETWAESGVCPGDVDVASVYDDYPVMVLVQLEDLGFAVDGDLERLVGEIASRALPVNTSGGQLSCGQAGAAGGMHGLVEVVSQLRGNVNVERQVAGARIGLVTGYGMVAYRHGACANAAVLERVV